MRDGAHAVVQHGSRASAAQIQTRKGPYPGSSATLVLEAQAAALAPIHRAATDNAERLLEALDYDFAGHFGVPGGSLAARAATIDRTIADWLDLHPDGLVISLGEGLETQVRRVDNGKIDAEWMVMVDPSRPLFIVAQGLFIYLEPDAVGGLLSRIAASLPGARLVFDIGGCEFRHFLNSLYYMS
jgi:O-methyltransferase involved in polyketide biosynthesis